MKNLWIFFQITCFSLFSQTTITVGNTGDYSTISSAYNSCTNAEAYIIEIQDDYVQESLPITFGFLTNKSIINNITIRPSSDHSGLHLINTGTEDDIIVINDGSYIAIDGRAGGSGDGVLTIENNQTSKGHAIKIEGDVENINLQYLTLLGSNQSTTVAYANNHAGVLMIGEIASGILSDITIDHCNVSKSTGGAPTYLITSYASSGNISYCTISNCDLSDATRRYINISQNSTDFTISNNNFYQNSSLTPTLNSTFCFIKFNAGSNYIISENYFGGQASNCGGDPFTINSSNAKSHLIGFDSSITGNCEIKGNYFQNINYTTINTTSPSFCIIAIEGGTGNYEIGSSSSPNIIGSTSSTDNILITDNGTTATISTALFYSTGSPTIDILYNQIGGITLEGTNTNGNFATFYTSDSETLNFSNNTIGNSTSENLIDNVTRTGSIYIGGKHLSSGDLNISNNTFQNVLLNESSSGSMFILETGTAASCIVNNNNIEEVEANRNGLIDLFYINITGEITFSNNTFSNLTFNSSSCQFYGIDLTSSSNDIECNSNTIGNSDYNNIIINGDTDHYMIYTSISSGKTATLSSNIIQEINCSNSGTSNQIHLLNTQGTGTVNISSNQFKHITSASNYSTTAIYGLYQNNTGLNNIISKNRFNDFEVSTTSATSTRFICSYLNAANTSGLYEKNRIIDMASKATGSPANYGVYSKGSGSSWDLQNNVIILDNESNTNASKIIGLRNDADGNTYLYHNTIKIGGTASSGSDYSAAYIENATDGTVRECYNNIFYNNRTGGTGNHYGVWNIGGTNFDFDYNYMEATHHKWNNVTYNNFSDFETNSSYSNNLEGTIAIDALGGVSSGSSGTIEGNGVDLLTPNKVTTDLDDNTRTITPWIGAFEVAQPLPIVLINFKGNLINNRSVELKWLVKNDWKDYLFEIDRSENGETFTNIYKSFNQIGTTNYSYTDEIENSTLIYYRLSLLNPELNLIEQRIISIENDDNEMKVIEQFDLMGNKINSEKPNNVVLDCYSNGSVVKKVIIEN